MVKPISLPQPLKITNSKKIKAYSLGLNAEKVVCDYLVNLSYEILEQRFKTPYGEIDIIARKDNVLVFIEVKARSKFEHFEILSIRQIKRILQAANYYLSFKSSLNFDQIRFDLILLNQTQILNHIENAGQSDDIN